MGETVTEMPGGWHLDKKISIGHLLTTATIGIALAVYVVRQEGRIDGNQQAIRYNKERIEQSERRMKDDMIEIKGALIRIEAKLDQKVDK